MSAEYVFCPVCAKPGAVPGMAPHYATDSAGFETAPCPMRIAEHERRMAELNVQRSGNEGVSEDRLREILREEIPDLVANEITR